MNLKTPVIALATSFFVFIVLLNVSDTKAIAAGIQPPVVVWKSSDILFSQRWPRISGDGNNVDAISAAKGFGATDLVWHYRGNSSPVFDFFKSTGADNQCALPVHIQFSGQNAESDWKEKACLGKDGNPVANRPDEIAVGLARGDVFKPLWLEKSWDSLRNNLSQGCVQVQQDDPTYWAGACYSSYADVGFRDFLKRRFTPAQLNTNFGITDITTFNYSGSSSSAALKNLYLEFSKLGVLKFYTELKQRTETYVAGNSAISKPVGFFGNVYDLEKWGWVLNVLDGVMTEFPVNYGGRGLLQRLVEDSAMTKLMGKHHYVVTLVSENLALNRLVMAASYALGAHMIMPWDVFISVGATTPRYFADPKDFADITDTIKNNADFFDGYHFVSAYNYTKDTSVSNLDYTADTSIAPRVASVDEVNLNNEPIDRLVVKLSHGISNTIPKGTKFHFIKGVYTTTGGTGVGNIYLPLASTNRSDIMVGSYVSKVEYPDGRVLSFQKVISPPLVRVGEGSVLIVVSRPGTNNSGTVLHVVDSVGAGQITLDIKSEDLFGETLTNLQMTTGASKVLMNLTSLGDGWYRLVIPKSSTWGILSKVKNVVADVTPPSVSITAPANSATVSGTITVSANASDNVGVAGVQFKLDGANLGTEDTTSPYSMSWNTTTASNGLHALTAVARDAAGNSATAANVNVTVSNIAPDTTQPVIFNVWVESITQTGTTITWTTNEASDSQVEYDLTTAYGSQTTLNTAMVTSHGQALSGLTAGKIYHFRVKSRDAAGNLATSPNATFTTVLTVQTPTKTPVISMTPTTSKPSASGLSASQIQSILDVLTSFNADADVIKKVRASLQGTTIGSVTSTAVHVFKTDLTSGSLGSDVKALQQFLNAHGYPVATSGAGSLGNETTRFGPATKAALIRYQKAKGIMPAAGYFGTKTRAAVSAER